MRPVLCLALFRIALLQHVPLVGLDGVLRRLLLVLAEQIVIGVQLVLRPPGPRHPVCPVVLAGKLHFTESGHLRVALAYLSGPLRSVGFHACLQGLIGRPSGVHAALPVLRLRQIGILEPAGKLPLKAVPAEVVIGSGHLLPFELNFPPPLLQLLLIRGQLLPHPSGIRAVRVRGQLVTVVIDPLLRFLFIVLKGPLRFGQ